MGMTMIELTTGNHRALRRAAAAHGTTMRAILARMADKYLGEGVALRRLALDEMDLLGHHMSKLPDIPRRRLQGMSSAEVIADMPDALVRAFERAGVPMAIVEPWLATNYTPQVAEALIEKLDDAYWMLLEKCGRPKHRGPR